MNCLEFAKMVGLFLAAAALVGCDVRPSTGRDVPNQPLRTGCAAKGEPVRIRLDNLLEWSYTNGFSRCPSDASRPDLIKGRLLEVEEVLSSVPDRTERIALMGEFSDRILDGIGVRTNGWEELDYYLSSCVLLDVLGEMMWKTTGDGEGVLALWTRQRNRYRGAADNCRKEACDIKGEISRLAREVDRQNLKLFTARTKALTPGDLAAQKECGEKLPSLRRRLEQVERLSDWYLGWDVGERGRGIGEGGLYRRFSGLQAGTPHD